ncbi:YfhD family protein [Paenibacillus mesophilus]|uniref:YfhD family protein n=1 Tax=Paenibacillus mesophilus TaxID=2582849 RepID=UPI00110E2E28|nr:YfhD family protein [Paenibacillus mesophilus]TMV43833.1 YfhD family protein [Paenibacillus mesophilus]
MSFEQVEANENEALPIGKNEDVDFSEALADEDDLEAVERAEAADNRQQND